MDKQNFIEKYFSVLDNGYVSLIDVMGDDAAICQAARVSYGKGTKSISDDRGLIRYLLRHKHTTPLEMVVFKFHIAMPIHVHIQFIRHRMSTTNEYSARYSVVPEVIYDEYHLNAQSKNNKQGRTDDNVFGDGYDVELKDKIHKNELEAFALYNEMTKAGVAREVARMHLPLNTYTYFYWKIDLHNLLHFLSLRCDGHAQYEIRQYANTLAGLVNVCCPAAFEAWEDYAFGASTLTRLDKILLDFVIRVKSDDPIAGYNNDEQVLKKAEEIGMSKREVAEFFEKLVPKDKVNFDLDLSTAKDASFYGSE
jgi:thymidylate synthase (FAD)